MAEAEDCIWTGSNTTGAVPIFSQKELIPRPLPFDQL